MNAELVLAIGAIITAVVAVLRSFSESRKHDADAAMSIGEAYGHLVTDLRQELTQAKSEITLLKTEMAGYLTKLEENRRDTLNVQSQLHQAMERFSVLEGENETLRQLMDK